MTLQLADSVRNALLDAIEADVGTSPVIKAWTGSVPANCAAADSGTELAAAVCPSDWMTAAVSGSKDKQGSWVDAAAAANGDAGHWRLYASDGVTCKMQGRIVLAATQTGDMVVPALDVTLGAPFAFNTFTLTAPGA